MKRILYVDYMRTLAIIGVLAIHLSSSYITETPIFHNYWLQGVLITSMARYSIILFIMISGLLLLGRENPIKSIPRRVKRVFTPFIIWFTIYFIIKAGIGFFGTDKTVTDWIILFITCLINPTKVSVQFWFVYMIISLYILTPIMSKCIKVLTDREIEFYLVIWFICLTLGFIDKNILILKYMNFFIGFLGYYILGYYLNNTDRPVFNNRKIAVLLFILGTLFTFIGTAAHTSITGQLSLRFICMGDLTPGACMEAIGIFIILKNINFSNIYGKFSDKINRQVTLISKLSYGMYLTNILLINLLEKIHLYSLKIAPLINIPFMIIIITIILMVMLLVMNKIPYINKATGI